MAHKMKKLIVYLSMFLLLGACSKRNDENNEADELDGKIVVILDSIPDTKRKELLNGGASTYPFVCSYINDEYEKITFLYPTEPNLCDTIVIETKRDAIIFSNHFQGSLSTIHFRLNKNQVYHIGYRDSIPYLKDNEDYVLINSYYDSLYHNIFIDKVSAERKVENIGPLLFIEFESFPPSKDMIKNGLSKLIDQIEKEVAWQEKCINSLYNTSRIIEDDYLLLKSELDLKKLIFNQSIKANGSHFFDDFQDRYRTDWVVDYSRIEQDSSTFYNPNYCELLSNHYNIGRHLGNMEVYSIAIMDSILVNETIPPMLVKYTLSQCLDQIYSEAPWDIIQKNSQEYLHLFPSSELPSHLMQKYSIDPSAINDVLLVNPQGQSTTLQDVLGRLYGKEVVLDVWASWCSPCMEKIKAEKEKRERQKRKGVEYVFITFMDNEADWKKRIVELGLEQEEHCYFTTNSQTSQWFTDMKISSIPRVIRYNKAGVIIGQEM